LAGRDRAIIGSHNIPYAHYPRTRDARSGSSHSCQAAPFPLTRRNLGGLSLAKFKDPSGEPQSLKQAVLAIPASLLSRLKVGKQKTLAAFKFALSAYCHLFNQ